MKVLQNAEPNAKEWMELCKLLLTLVVMFNRRRSGETERLLLTDYKKVQEKHNELQVPQEVFDSLGHVEKALCQKLCRIEVVGKRGRIVPIVLTEEMQIGIDLLNSTRRDVGVSQENPYVFARPYFQSKFPMTTSKAMKTLAEECGAKLPQNVRSSNLRKHIATMTQLLSLKENELDMLAGYMGHDIRVHREFYRLPQSTLQLAKVSKVLIMMERGLAGKFHGKSLDEIDINLEVGRCSFRDFPHFHHFQ